jgi:2-polyprenyl-6-methoxyphenol hydroxylase-like FAD-dependent oxidoreductase
MEKLNALLLVAADGVYSNIRTLIGLESAKVCGRLSKWLLLSIDAPLTIG